jgi:Xaa-Pro aminopeptidase
MTLKKLQSMQEAIREERLDGWLFCNFSHRDRLADEILHIDPRAANTRLWVYAVPASGEPLGILHAVESGILGDLPGGRISYRSREELLDRLGALGGKRWGLHVSEYIPAISCVDGGTLAVFEQAGLIPASAAGLIQRFRGLLDPAGMASHERAAAQLYEIVALAWSRIRGAHAGGYILHEGDIQALILSEMERRNLVADHPPIVAAGVNTGDPHYEVRGGGAIFRQDDVIQLDLWAREAGGIYADISWVGVYGTAPRPEYERAFADVIAAREGAWEFIRGELAAGRRPAGADVDQTARKLLTGRGHGDALRHRTGHGIDTEVHGSGVNMDSVEFPDSRLLLDGACFSLEPGIYFPGFGMRTEIDVYIRDGEARVSGGERQFQILTCGGI